MVHLDMSHETKVLPARFFRTAAGNEPVRQWLKELEKEDRATIGDDIRTIEFGWPMGMPLCRSLQGHKDLWEVRTKLTGGRIARVFFFVSAGEMILLHGFIKKTQKTATRELKTAIKRKKDYEKHV
jgi:phage-related protein